MLLLGAELAVCFMLSWQRRCLFVLSWQHGCVFGLSRQCCLFLMRNWRCCCCKDAELAMPALHCSMLLSWPVLLLVYAVLAVLLSLSVLLLFTLIFWRLHTL